MPNLILISSFFGLSLLILQGQFREKTPLPDLWIAQQECDEDKEQKAQTIEEKTNQPMTRKGNILNTHILFL
jgi:hypothetical protein